MKNFYDLVTVANEKGNIAENICKTITKYASGMPIIIKFDDEEDKVVLNFKTGRVKIPVESIDASENNLVIKDSKEGFILIFKETSEENMKAAADIVLEETGMTELKNLLSAIGLCSPEKEEKENVTPEEIALLSIISYVMSH